MTRVVYHVATTIDGFISREDGTWDFFPQEGDHIADYLESFKTYESVIMGRKTYDVGLAMGVTDPYPMLRTYVVSRTMTESPDPKVTLVNDDLAGLVRKLKQESERDVYLCGGSELATQLIADGLVDRIVLKLNPVALGTGLSLFSRLDHPYPLELVDTKRYESGVVLLTYDVKA